MFYNEEKDWRGFGLVILGEKGLSAVVKYMLDLVFAGGMMILISLPISLRWCFNNFFWTTGEHYRFLLIFLAITGTFCLIIVQELRKIFKTLKQREPFKRDNVTSLKRIAVMAILISAAYLIKIIFYISFLTIIVMMVFLIMGLFALILSEVFRQAIEVKEENDLTI